VGIFAIATEKFVLVPKTISAKEERVVKGLFGADIIKASIANSGLLGVLAAGNSRGIVAGSVIEGREEKELLEAGVRVKTIENFSAVGNLLAVNDSKGICPNAFSEKQRKEIERFLGVELMEATIAGSDVVGAGIVATNRGFVLNKTASAKEAEEIEKHFGIKGTKATANAGDCFLGNSLVANGENALAGINTTGFELSRIDEGLRG
jgi:translation initiation factor 6